MTSQCFTQFCLNTFCTLGREHFHNKCKKKKKMKTDNSPTVFLLTMTTYDQKTKTDTNSLFVQIDVKTNEKCKTCLCRPSEKNQNIDR